MNIFYVYRYIRLDTNKPFYVGKGKNRRAKQINSHNNFCKNIHAKHGTKIEYIRVNISEEEAFSLEKMLITLYKTYNLCEANIDPGGRGNSGRVSPMKGRKHSKETKEKISKGGLGRKVSDETKKILSSHFSGKLRPEIGFKVSKALKGKTTWMKGKSHKKESIELMSKSKIGKIPWNKHLKMS